MKVSITNLSHLANLHLSEDQKNILEESIPSVVTHLEEIKQLDVSEVKETNGASEEENIFAEDTTEPSLTQKEALQNAKDTYNGFFVVPYVFEEDENVTQ